MIKKIGLTAVLLLTISVLVFGAFNNTQASSGDDTAGRGGPGRGLVTGQPGAAQTASTAAGLPTGNGYQGGGITAGEHIYLAPAASGDLSAAEAAALAYMREEEKLAHDVYLALAEKWGLPVFQNIAASEQTHGAAVKALLDRYGVQDPASSQPGIFSDPGLQKLYNDLIAQSGKSLADALKAAALIEETDIADLEKRLALTDNADIQQVFTSLKNGSYNHLRAFTSTLQTQTGEAYQPQVLSADTYQAILGAMGGSGYGRGGGQAGGGYRGGRP